MDDSRDILIMVVEDDPDLLELTGTCLEQEDLLVVTARDGQRALRLLEVVRPNVVVTDLMMPVMDGFGLLQEYKRRPDAVPVVAMSSLKPYLERARDLGADAIIAKPFDVDRLVKLVRDLARGEPAKEPSAEQARDLGEESRLQAIMDLKLDEPAPEIELKEFVDDVARHFDVPIALISVITQERQYWTAGCGIPDDLTDERGTERRESFCTHAVAARAALVVQDALQNPFFRDNPFVRVRGIRFYAGVPLIARHGQVLGTLCLLDYRARFFSHADLELLTVFGRCVLAALEWRERDASPEIPDSAFRYLHYIDHDLQCFGALAFRDLAIVEGARASEGGHQIACVAMSVSRKRLGEAVEALRRRHVRGLVGRIGHARLGWLVPDVTAEQARQMAQEIAGPHGFVEAVQLERYPGAIREAVFAIEEALGDAGLA